MSVDGRNITSFAENVKGASSRASVPPLSYARTKYKYQQELLLRRGLTFHVLDAKLDGSKCIFEVTVKWRVMNIN